LPDLIARDTRFSSSLNSKLLFDHFDELLGYFRVPGNNRLSAVQVDFEVPFAFSEFSAEPLQATLELICVHEGNPCV
jgi:hypothetical protein